MKPEILVVAKFPSFLDARLQRDYIVHDLARAPDRQALLAEVAPRVRAVVPGATSVLEASLIEGLPKLELISVFGVGYDRIDIAAAKRRGVIVSNTPGVLTECVADIGLALTLNVLRRLAEAHALAVAGNWPKGGLPLSRALGGRTAGILGLGRIGKAIARRLQACGMKIAYHGRRRQEDVPYAYHATLPDLARDADVLVVACEGGPATHHLVDAGVLAALGSDSVIINIARGSVIDEEALIVALENGTIKAAGLDVYTNEPNIPARLRALPNVVLFPHVGSGTLETRTAMANLCCDNLDAHFAGKPVLARVE